MNFVLELGKNSSDLWNGPTHNFCRSVLHLRIHNYKIKIPSQGWKDGWAVKSVNSTAGQLGLAPTVQAMWRFPSSSTCTSSSRGADTFGIRGPPNSHVHTPCNMQHTNVVKKNKILKTLSTNSGKKQQRCFVSFKIK